MGAEEEEEEESYCMRWNEPRMVLMVSGVLWGIIYMTYQCQRNGYVSVMMPFVAIEFGILLLCIRFMQAKFPTRASEDERKWVALETRRLAAQAARLPYPVFRLAQFVLCVAPVWLANLRPGYPDGILLMHGLLLIFGLEYSHAFYTLLVLHHISVVAVSLSLSVGLLALLVSSCSFLIILLCGIYTFLLHTHTQQEELQV